jgi:centromere protein S
MASNEAMEREEVRKLPPEESKQLLTSVQRLKSALWYQIGQFVDEEAASKDFNATPQFIGALTELVYTQIGKKLPTLPPFHSPILIFPIHTIPNPTTLYQHPIANSARDLEVFSKHAGRKVIATDDVMLLTRRNEALESILKQELDQMKAAEGRGGGAQVQKEPKKRGRPAGAGRGKGKMKA